MAAIAFFKETVHVECVALLTQCKPDMSIEITMNEEDLELTRAEAKATYKEITDYVMNRCISASAPQSLQIRLQNHAVSENQLVDHRHKRCFTDLMLQEGPALTG